MNGKAIGMISCRPFRETLNRRDISAYELIYRQGVSANTVCRMKHGAPITAKTRNGLCFILDCSVSDVVEYVNESD